MINKAFFEDIAKRQRDFAGAYGRTLDPTYPTNLAIMLIALAGFIGATVYYAQLGLPLVPSLSQGGRFGLALFFAWGLARELDPDHEYSAFVAVALAGISWYALTAINFPALFMALLIFRILNRVVGIRARVGDSLFVFAALAWIILLGNWAYGLLAALAFILDGTVLPNPNPRHKWLGAGLGLIAGWGMTQEFILVDIQRTTGGLVALLIGSVMFGLVSHRLTSNMNSLCDATGEKVNHARMRVTHGFYLGMVWLGWALQGEAVFTSLLPILAVGIGIVAFEFVPTKK